MTDWRRERGGTLHLQAAVDQGHGRHHPTGKVYPDHLHTDVPGKYLQPTSTVSTLKDVQTEMVIFRVLSSLC